ncbi:MAG: hypothetical protein FWF81_07010, partial [Defluviitaleaceae bacterium]|nr:hypothetical protein [Defluviitaleaceae bacterium]
MTKSSGGLFRKTVALLLVIIFSMPHVVIAEENPWLNLPVIASIGADYFPDEFIIEDYAEMRLQSLLSRMHEFDSFTAEEQYIVMNHSGGINHSAFHEFAFVETENEIHTLLNDGRTFSEITENERFLIFNHLNIPFEEFWAASTLFLRLEQYDVSLFESVERIRVEMKSRDMSIGTILQIVPDLFSELRFWDSDSETLPTTTGPALGLSLYGYEIESEYLNDASQEYAAFAPFSATHADITSNPFNLRFNPEESVTLNTGAVIFRQHIISLPGRGGFNFNLDLVYDSSTSGIFNFNPYRVALGWAFDLPFIHNNSLHVPGRGTFELSGNTILRHYTRDMWLEGSGNNRVLRFYNGTRYNFTNGRITSMSDRFSNTIRFEYGDNGLTRIIDTSGTAIHTGFDVQGNNHMMGVIGPRGDSITLHRSVVTSHLRTNHLRLDRISIPRVGNIYFNYNTVNSWLDWRNQQNNNQSWLLNRVTYTSGAELHFRYGLQREGYTNREMWRITSRHMTPRAGTRIYNQVTFSHWGRDTTASNANYGVNVTQNNNVSTRYTFNYRHLKTEQSVWNNNTRVSLKNITYNELNLPSTIELSEFRGSFTRRSSQEFSYNRYGQITRAVNPLSQEASYTYDSRFGILARREFLMDANTRIAEVNTLSGDGRSIIRASIYENGTLQSRTDFLHDIHGNVTEIREFPDVLRPDAITTQIIYNRGVLPQTIRTTGVRNVDGTLLNGNGTVERHFTYDPRWLVLSETDPNGYVTRWQYDGLGRVTRIDFPDGGYATYTYDDAFTFVTHTTVLGAVYHYHYDSFGNLRIISHNGISILTNVYDNRMRLIESRNTQGLASSQRTHISYDVFDRVTETRITNESNVLLYRETTAYFDVNDSAGNSRIVTTVHGATNAPSIQTFVQYDRFGRRTQEGTMGGRIFTYTHDFAGRVVNERSLGIDNTFSYNVFGVTEVRNIENNTSRNVYDSMGRLIRSSDFMGNYTRFYYDSLGRLIQRRTPFQREGIVIIYAATRYFYDRGGNLLRQDTQTNLPSQPTSWSSIINTFRYNRLTRSQIGGTGSAGITTNYTYNHAGNILSTEIGGATTTFTYDNRGRLTQTRDAMGNTETFTYDNNGNMLTKTDRNGTLFRMTYDGMGRMTRQEAVQNGVVTGHRTYTFTQTGAVRSITNGSHTTSKVYDPQGRLVRIDDSENGLIHYAYNEANNRTMSRIAFASHMYTNWYAYTASQRLAAVHPHGETLRTLVTYTYDANGNIISETNGAGIRTEHTRNLAGLITLTAHRQDNTTHSFFRNEYYLDGNISMIFESIARWPNHVKTFRYDAARRLIEEQMTDTIQTTRKYTFDERGNRSSIEVTGNSRYWEFYEYNANNQLTRITRLNRDLSTEFERTDFTYDRNGNQLTQTTSGVTETRTYNGFNQLTQVTRPGRTTTYTYRADGLRHSKTVNNVTTTHVWNGPHIVRELNASGALVNAFHLCLSGRVLQSEHHGWYLYNSRGDVVHRVNQSGGLLQNYRYTAFGIEQRPNPQNTNPFRFNGEYWDWEREEYYLRARSFNPRTGRFTQPDP